MTNAPRVEGALPSSILARALLTLLTLLALGLRLAGSSQSLFGDELYAYYELLPQTSVAGVVDAVRHGQEVSPPLFFVLAWLSSKVGDPMAWIRLPSILAGVLTVPLVYAVGRRTVGPAAGLVGAALMALSAYAIFYSVEARPYSLLCFFLVLSTLALLEAVRTGGTWWWLLFATATAAAIYTHYSGVFAIVAQAAWAMWFHRERRRALALCYLGVALAYLPWIAVVHDEVSRVESLDLLCLPITWSNLTQTGGRLAIGAPFTSIANVPGTLGTGLVVAGLAVGIAGVLAGPRRVPGAARCEGVALLGLLALLAGALVTAPRRPVVALAASALLLAGFAAGAVLGFGDDARRSPYAEMASYIEARSSSADPVLMDHYDPAQARLRGLDPHLVPPRPTFNLSSPEGRRRALATGASSSSPPALREPLSRSGPSRRRWPPGCDPWPATPSRR